MSTLHAPAQRVSGLRESIVGDGIVLRAPIPAEAAHVLTPDALAFVAKLQRAFGARRDELLVAREARQLRLDLGEQPGFLPETAHVRAGDWSVSPLPADLLDRRVEITGPVDRKMIINALNSGAKVFMADFEDSQSPTWEGQVCGQANLFDAVRGSISFTNPDGKRYALVEKPAVLMVRPRGWHLDERHMLVDGEAVSGSLFDFGLFFYHNAKELLAKGSGPYFYLPKLENHMEARLWNDVFVFAQRELGMPQGTIKATVLIETILAAFEMDEILFELRQHIAGLNCGRWDYIFSYIKKLRNQPDALLPDRAQVTMLTRFLRSYSQLLIQTCHKRGAFAMGGMSAYIPVKSDPVANEKSIAAVRADKQREAGDGHDGTWVAHPGLVPVAMEIFDAQLHSGATNQLHVLREDVRVQATDLLAPPTGSISMAGLRNNITVSIRYIESYLRGVGCVPIFNLMEDAATAEICRAQVWQWINHPRGVLDDGRNVTIEMVRVIIEEERSVIASALKAAGVTHERLSDAIVIFDALVSSRQFKEFLTLPAYDQLTRDGA
jgi:malate synthase